MLETEKAWLAGILEGEGSFWILKKKRQGNLGGHYHYPKISVVMTDKDVIDRVARLFGNRATTPAPGRDGRRMTYRANLMGQDALNLMVQVRPYMGERRGAKIDELLVQFGRAPFARWPGNSFVPTSNSGS